jgi:hypothetical protein
VVKIAAFLCLALSIVVSAFMSLGCQPPRWTSAFRIGRVPALSIALYELRLSAFTFFITARMIT